MNNIKRVIFVDSTISHQELAQSIHESDLLLPAIKRGDLIQAFITYPSIKTAIIVDGVFEQQASVTHKEILWAIAQGIEIIGIASIGALRAYELRDYGVVGYGKIYQAYLTGVLNGDDEVAISHFPSGAILDKTIAMVNIRRTFEKLNNSDEQLIFTIRKINFKHRTWDSLKAAIPGEIYKELKAHYIDQKKEDVLSYFQLKLSSEPCLNTDKKNSVIPFSKLPVSSNSYIIKNLVSLMYTGSIDFIEQNLKKINLISKQTFEPTLEKTADEIAKYLEFNTSYIPKIAYILHELQSFKYCKTRLKNGSIKIRREQKLCLLLAFIQFLQCKKILESSLPAIFEGILMLEDYFLINNLID